MNIAVSCPRCTAKVNVEIVKSTVIINDLDGSVEVSFQGKKTHKCGLAMSPHTPATRTRRPREAVEATKPTRAVPDTAPKKRQPRRATKAEPTKQTRTRRKAA